MKKLLVAVLLLSVSALLASGSVEIFSWWTGGGEEEGLAAIYEVFKAKFPDVEIINATVAGGAGTNAKAVLKTRMLGGNPPDSFQVHGGMELIDTYVITSMMEPLTDILEGWGILDKFPKDIMTICSYEGEVYSIPVNVHRGNVMFINNEILKNAGVETVPQDGPGFLQVCEKIKQAGFIPLALGDKDKWEAAHLFETVLLSALGPEGYNGLWNGTTSFNDPGIGRAIVIFEELIKYVNEDHAALSWDQAAQIVADGDAAMTIMGDWAEGYFKSIGLTPDQEFGWVPSPGTDGIFMMLSDSFGLPQGAPHRDNAVAWLTLAGSREGQDAFNPLKGSIPARTDGDRSLYDAYLQSAMDDFAANEIAASLAHGAAASEGWVTAVNDAMTLFVSDLDVAAAQTAMAQACADAGVCQ